MKNLILIVFLFSLTNFAEDMKLRSFSSNMPKNLVEEYEKSENIYADVAENPWYSSLLYYHKKGFVSRVDEGYHAELFSGYGPCLAIYMNDQVSDFDEDGVLTANSYSSGLLWGLLYSSETSIDKNSRYQRESSAWDVLFGFIGYDRDKYGKKKIKLLWIPISVN